MKRMISLLAVSATMVLMSASMALADSHYPPEQPPSVAGESGGGGTAFTGGDVSFGMIAVVVLLAVGLGALFVARRRAARLAA
ncbi:MAG TPA: hypothetical protein VF235_08390 [Actinomycetota bacterium]